MTCFSRDRARGSAVVAVEQLQRSFVEVVAPAAVAPCERREPLLDRLGVGSCSRSSAAARRAGTRLVDEALAAGEDRAPAVMPQAAIGAAHRPWSCPARLNARAAANARAPRARSALSPACRLAALARAIRPRRAIRAHITHVIAAADQVHRGVPAPARRTLDPPASDLPELPRPRLQRTVPIARDTKVLRGENPAAWINDRRGQRPLMRIDPDHIASVIGVSNRCDGPGPRFFAVLIACLDLQAYVVDGGSADNLPVAPYGRTLLSSQTDPRSNQTSGGATSQTQRPKRPWPAGASAFSVLDSSDADRLYPHDAHFPDHEIADTTRPARGRRETPAPALQKPLTPEGGLRAPVSRRSGAIDVTSALRFATARVLVLLWRPTQPGPVAAACSSAASTCVLAERGWSPMRRRATPGRAWSKR